MGNESPRFTYAAPSHSVVKRCFFSSGGDYVPRDNMTEDDGCWPYDFPPCAHFFKDPKYPACPKVSYGGDTRDKNCRWASARLQTSRLWNTVPQPEVSDQFARVNLRCVSKLRHMMVVYFSDRYFMVESVPYHFSADDAKNAIRTDGPVGAIHTCDPKVNFAHRLGFGDFLCLRRFPRLQVRRVQAHVWFSTRCTCCEDNWLG